MMGIHGIHPYFTACNCYLGLKMGYIPGIPQNCILNWKNDNKNRNSGYLIFRQTHVAMGYPRQIHAAMEVLKFST